MTDDKHMRVRKPVWERLHRHKEPGDSFADVIDRALDALEARDDEGKG